MARPTTHQRSVEKKKETRGSYACISSTSMIATLFTAPFAHLFGASVTPMIHMIFTPVEYDARKQAKNAPSYADTTAIHGLSS